MLQKQKEEVARALLQSEYGVVFTGAGISVASGVPTFRGGRRAVVSL